MKGANQILLKYNRLSCLITSDTCHQLYLVTLLKYEYLFVLFELSFNHMMKNNGKKDKGTKGLVHIKSVIWKYHQKIQFILILVQMVIQDTDHEQTICT